MTQSLCTIKRDIYLQGQQHSRTCFIRLSHEKSFRAAARNRLPWEFPEFTKHALGCERRVRLRTRCCASTFAASVMRPVHNTRFRGGNIHPFGAEDRRQRQIEWTESPGQSYFGEDVASRRSLGDVEREALLRPVSTCGTAVIISSVSTTPCRGVFLSSSLWPLIATAKSTPNTERSAPMAPRRARRRDGESETERERERERERGREKKRRSQDTDEETARNCAVKPRQWRDPKTASRGCLFRWQDYENWRAVIYRGCPA